MKKNLQQLFDEYIFQCRHVQRLRPETLRGYTEVFRQLSNLMPEVKQPEDLSTDILSEFFIRLNTRPRITGKDNLRVGIKDSTAGTYWSKLNTFFEWLYQKGYLVQNPLKHLKKPHVSYTDQKSLSETEVQKIITAITLYPKNALMLKRDLAMVYTLLFCGLRFGEFVALKVPDIDFQKRLLTVQGTTSKSKRTRILPMHTTLSWYLEEYIKERNKKRYTTEYLFVSTNTDNGLSRMGIKHWVERLKAHSGVKFHLHQFRHTFACNLAKHDIGAVKIQKLMGHTDIEMTLAYLRSFSSEDLQEDIERLSL